MRHQSSTIFPSGATILLYKAIQRLLKLGKAWLTNSRNRRKVSMSSPSISDFLGSVLEWVWTPFLPSSTAPAQKRHVPWGSRYTSVPPSPPPCCFRGKRVGSRMGAGLNSR